MKAVLYQMAPSIPAIDILPMRRSAIPRHPPICWRPTPNGNGLPLRCRSGVGGTRRPSFWRPTASVVGPGNGLFELIERRATSKRSWDIDWKPKRLSASFHGRDLFAPVAAMLARGEPPPGRPRTDQAHRRTDWPDDLSEIAYIDHYGNAMSGVRALMLPRDAQLVAAGRVLQRAGTFSDQPPGTAFWYENSNGACRNHRQSRAR